jgi:surface polysaccharide O-acyltransferase-like enzyme
VAFFPGVKAAMSKKETLLWADVLKIASIFAVVLIHAAAPFLLQYHKQGGAAWWAGNAYDSLARWCIPLFFMLSGAFLIPEASQLSLKSFFSRRFRRVFIPFVVWSGIYFLWRIHVNGEALAWKSFLPLFLREPLYYHLWFFYVLVELYLLAPIVAVFTVHARKSTLWYFFILCIIFGSLLPQIQTYVKLDTYFTLGKSSAIFAYVGIFMLGHVLREILPSAAVRVVWTLIFLLALSVTAFGTYLLTVRQNNGVLGELFYEYFSVNVTLMAVAVYLNGKCIPQPAGGTADKPVLNLIQLIATCVPGIYLIHPMMMTLFAREVLGFTLTGANLPPTFGIPLFALAVFTGSLICVLVLKLIPGIKYIVP